MGFIGMIKMVSCLVAQQRDNILQSDIWWNPEEQGLPIKQHQSITIICNKMMHEHGMK